MAENFEMKPRMSEILYADLDPETRIMVRTCDIIFLVLSQDALIAKEVRQEFGEMASASAVFTGHPTLQFSTETLCKNIEKVAGLGAVIRVLGEAKQSVADQPQDPSEKGQAVQTRFRFNFNGDGEEIRNELESLLLCYREEYKEQRRRRNGHGLMENGNGQNGSNGHY